jgi:hypothetical protein
MLPRYLDGIAGSLLLGLGILLIGGNLVGEVSGGFQIDAGEAAFLGFMAVLSGFGTFLLYLAARKANGGW